MRTLPLLLLASLQTLASCATDGDYEMNDSDKFDELGCEKPVYEYLADDSSTEERIDDLNVYATKRLASYQCRVDTILAQRGQVGAADVSKTYTMEVGSRELCFNDGFGFADFDIDSQERYKDMKTQVDYAAEFLATLHGDADGRPVPFMQTLAICPKEGFGEEFSLSGGRLFVNVDFAQIIGNSFQTYDARDLLEAWDDGDHLHDQSDKIQLAWPFINPTGTFRTSMRRGTLKTLMRLAGKLLNIREKLGGSDSGARSAVGDPGLEARRLIKENVSEGFLLDGEVSLRDTAMDAVEAATDDELYCILTEWHGDVGDPERANLADQAGVAAMQGKIKNLDIDVFQLGFLIHGNSHFIDVDLSGWFTQGYGDLTRYVEVLENTKSVNIVQIGIGLTYSLDDVNVGVEFHVDKAVQTAGIERALEFCMPQALP
ncbi:MAG: hypothetical protein GY811_03870 [Myxococcales bacterium]|nr:hypothetical protein [Myxococcales bacterium]